MLEPCSEVMVLIAAEGRNLAVFEYPVDTVAECDCFGIVFIIHIEF